MNLMRSPMHSTTAPRPWLENPSRSLCRTGTLVLTTRCCDNRLNPPRHARTIIRNSQYSVSARLIGRRVWVVVRSNEVIVLDGRTVIARRVRFTHPW